MADLIARNMFQRHDIRALTDSMFVLSAIAVISAAAMSPQARMPLAFAMLSVLLAAAVRVRSFAAIRVTLLFWIWSLIGGFLPFFDRWPLKIAAPLACYLLAVRLIKPLRPSTTGWLRQGALDRTTNWLVFLTIALSSLALVAWAILAKPDLERHLAVLRALPGWLYPLAAVGFAMGNAAMEEAVFRGIMQQSLDDALGKGACGIGAQALSFAAFHYAAGFPNGWIGFFMVWVYGIQLGILRYRSRGMLAPWLAHVGADLTIFFILAVILL